VGDIAYGARLALSQHLTANGGAQAVGADHGRAFDRGIVDSVQPHTITEVFVGNDLGQRHQFDVIAGATGIEQRCVQIDTVDDDVGSLEAPLERGPGRDAGDHAAVD